MVEGVLRIVIEFPHVQCTTIIIPHVTLKTASTIQSSSVQGKRRERRRVKFIMMPGKHPSCACCVAAMLAAHDATATPTISRVTAEQAPFLEYYPQTNVDEFAALDLDQRSIVARLATGDEEGLSEARAVYSDGKVTDDDEIPSVTLRDLSIGAGEQLVNSSTYKTFVDFYGGSDYADRWVSASFEGISTDDAFGFDFSQVDVEGRAGKKYDSSLCFCS